MATQRKPKTDTSAPASEPVDEPSPPPPPPKKRGKLLIVAGALLLAIAGGGIAFYFMQPGDSAARPVEVKPPVFLPLESFTVNLTPDGGSMQFMQAGITLKLAEKATADVIKERLPEVRNGMLLVLSAKKGAELLSVSGKQKLALEMSEAILKVISPPAAAATAQNRPAAPDNGDAAEAKAAAKAEAKASSTAAGPAEPTPPGIEVLFTSFIIQ
jgi:flagellar protein FliL